MSESIREALTYLRRAPSSLFPYAVVGIIGIVVWLNGAYTGDDRNTLYPVAQHSLTGLIRYYMRPIEYFVVQAANYFWLPSWIAASVIFCVSASVAHLRTAEIVLNTQIDNRLKALVVVGNPVWFYAVSQVDTVSESLCNLIFSICLLNLANLLFSSDGGEANKRAANVNLYAALLLFTKELAVSAAFVLPAIAALEQVRFRRWDMRYAFSLVLLALAFVVWGAAKITLGGMLPESGGHYNTTPGLIDLVRNTMAAFSFALTPLPSSFISMSFLTWIWSAAGICTTIVFFWTLRRINWQVAGRIRMAVAVLGACFPMFYVHVSELYASMISGLLIAVFVLLIKSRRIAESYCVSLLACSLINCAIYYNPEPISAAERRPYSIYFGPNGQFFGETKTEHLCRIRETRTVEWNNDRLLCR